MNIVLTQNRRGLIEENENLKVIDSLFNAIDWCNTNETNLYIYINAVNENKAIKGEKV